MLDATRYDRIAFDRYHFRGFHGCDAFCALEILRIPDGRSVVIATELKDNPGTSVTNFCEHLAHRVCAGFLIDPSKLVWIEHYGYPLPGTLKRHLRTYDLVTFLMMPARNNEVFASPKWCPMQDEDWLELGLEPREPGP